MHFQHILSLFIMRCGRFRVLKYPCTTVNLALSLSVSQSCLRLYPSHIHIPTFLLYLPKNLSHMKEGVKELKPVRRSFGVLGNIFWKCGTAVCFVFDLLITPWLYVPPFSKSIRPYYKSNRTEMRSSKYTQLSLSQPVYELHSSTYWWNSKCRTYHVLWFQE